MNILTKAFYYLSTKFLSVCVHLNEIWFVREISEIHGVVLDI